MKKIVYVVGGLYSLTGMNSILSKKINWLAEHTDYELYMILTEKAEAPWVFDINKNVKWVNFNINFDELDTMPLPKKIIYYIVKQRRYRYLFTKYLLDIRPDITVSAIRREINFINSINDGSKKVGEIHFTRDFYRKCNKSYLPTCMNTHISKWWMNSLIKQIRKLDRFIVLTEEDATHWPELSNIIVIPNFIPEYKGNYSKLNSKSAIAVGRYSWEKGIDLLIEAWSIVAKSHPNWKLNIYGAGDFEPYKRMIEEKDLGSVVKCNPPSTSIYDKYQESSIFVLSSRHEGFGLVLLEAMSVGLPPVAFACPCGPRNILEDGVDGILVEKENIKELAKGICYLIDHPEDRACMSQKAVLKAAKYPASKIMPKWVELFESI